MENVSVRRYKYMDTLNLSIKQKLTLTDSLIKDKLGIDRVTLLRYENGQIAEENMQVDWLIQIGDICGMGEYFCCSPYHIFLLKDAGEKIKQYRKQMGLTQKKLAAQCGVALKTFKQWEGNENKPLRLLWKLVTKSIAI